MVKAAGPGRTLSPEPALSAATCPCRTESVMKKIQAKYYHRGRLRKVWILVVHSMESPEKPTTAEDVAAWFGAAGRRDVGASASTRTAPSAASTTATPRGRRPAPTLTACVGCDHPLCEPDCPRSQDCQQGEPSGRARAPGRFRVSQAGGDKGNSAQKADARRQDNNQGVI
jgi:hypothetical protein